MDLTGKVVLIVDDERPMRKVLGELIKGIAGCQVLEAEDGEHALKIMDAVCVDLVITDGQMPKLDGFGLIKRIQKKEEEKRKKIVFMSADSGSVGKASLLIGEESCVEKPFSIGVLKDLIAAL